MVLKRFTYKFSNFLEVECGAILHLIPIKNSALNVQPIHETLRSFLLEPNTCPKDFLIDKAFVHDRIASACLQYLLVDHKQLDSGFLNYAARYWPFHLKAIAPDARERLECSLVFRLFKGEMPNWLSVYNPDGTSPNTFPSPLYYSAPLGLTNVAKLLLDEGADVNAQGGHFGNALQAASQTGHRAVVQLLLGKGADVNAQRGLFGNPLYAASLNGYEAVVQLLLDRTHHNHVCIDPIPLFSKAFLECIRSCAPSRLTADDTFQQLLLRFVPDVFNRLPHTIPLEKKPEYQYQMHLRIISKQMLRRNKDMQHSHKQQRNLYGFNDFLKTTNAQNIHQKSFLPTVREQLSLRRTLNTMPELNILRFRYISFGNV